MKERDRILEEGRQESDYIGKEKDIFKNNLAQKGDI